MQARQLTRCGRSSEGVTCTGEEMTFLRTCRAVLRELRLASPTSEGEGQWRYIVSATRVSNTLKDGPSKQRGEKILRSYLTYLQSSRQHRVSLAFLYNVIMMYLQFHRICWLVIRVEVKGQWKRARTSWD